MPYAFYCSVVYVNIRRFHAVGQVAYNVLVVLAGYIYSSRLFVPYGVVAAVVTELHFICISAQGKAYYLVAHTNTYKRLFTDNIFCRKI